MMNPTYCSHSFPSYDVEEIGRAIGDNVCLLMWMSGRLSENLSSAAMFKKPNKSRWDSERKFTKSLEE